MYSVSVAVILWQDLYSAQDLAPSCTLFDTLDGVVGADTFLLLFYLGSLDEMEIMFQQRYMGPQVGKRVKVAFEWEEVRVREASASTRANAVVLPRSVT